ncbi:RagB/SusD family nutrient uptake outer membrane protein [Gaoshiqia sp. Z1-71]|uniref:RagB/SusD family nutrient uptake outer membrane protein n=1 Tax=Gaoshiqia hydrogeniformans TaxID=3290090 RepID=UPI003BF8BC8F
MKKIIRYFLILMPFALLYSCNYLDVVPDNVATLDNAFSDRYTAEKYLATCYWSMPKLGGWNENPAMFGAMEMIFNKEDNGGGMLTARGYDSPTEAFFNYWSATGTPVRSLYAGINNCNIFLANINNVRDLETYERNRLIAEVKTIKAYLHFYMLTYYGPICPLKENTEINESTEGVRVYREKVDDTFSYILDLLNEAIHSKALPVQIQNRTTELGRFTQAAASFLKAKVMIYWASPLFNGNTNYESFLDHKGEPFFNQTYDPDRWKRAADACDSAIMVSNSCGNRLYQVSDYVTSKPISAVTKRLNMLRHSVSERWNCELIWGNTTWPVDAGVQEQCIPRFEEATQQTTTGNMSIPLNIAEKFYSRNGVPIDEDPDFDYAHRYSLRTGDESHKYYIQRGEQTAALNFDREPRFYSTLGFDRGKWYGNSYKNEPDDDAECLYPKNRFGEFSSVFQPGDYNATGYFAKKLVSVNTTYRDRNTVTYERYPFPDMRFAELLLFYAEALNEMKNAPDEQVYQYLDMVRERAGLAGVVESWRNHSIYPDKPLTKAGMREIIHRERAIELACEGAYFWDTRRWKTAVKELNGPVKGWDVTKSDVHDYYTVKTVYNQTFSFKNYFAPIPESDIIKNPNLVQNPGW